MSSVEIIILSVTGVIAMLTYIVKHFKKSTCWSSDSCFTCNMDKDDKSKSEVVIEEPDDEKVEPRIIVSSVV